MNSCTLIGCGNMGGTLIKGIRRAYPKAVIHLYDTDQTKAEALATEISGVTHTKLTTAIQGGDLVILGVKPHQLQELGSQVQQNTSGKRVLSIAAGVSTSSLEKWFSTSEVVRFMPNIGALGGASTTGVTTGTSTSKQFLQDALSIAESIGVAYPLKEEQFAAFTGMSGSGIAYCLQFLRYLAEAGSTEGLPSDQTLSMAIDTMKSAIALIETSQESPQTLIPKITSPNGTTLEGLQALEDRDLRGTLQDATQRAAKRAREIGKEYQ